MKIYAKTTIIFYTIISNTISKTIYNTKTAVDKDNINLNNFMNLLHNAQVDLKWIRDTNQLYRGQRADSTWLSSPDINSISTGDSQTSGDKWYKQFRDDEIKLNGGVSNPPISAADDNNDKKIDKQNLQDQSETTKNDLSHEANYKLSKFEQEKEEKNRIDKENQKKIQNLPINNDILLNKRKVDANQEIRLKIRSRLSDRYGAYIDRQLAAGNFSIGDDYDEYQKTHRKIPNYNLFKREAPKIERPFANRKLLVQCDYDEEDYVEDSPRNNDNDRTYKKYEFNRNKRQKDGQDKTPDICQNDMVTGILPNKLVKAIFTLAEKNENLAKHVAPNVNIKSFVEIKKADVQEQASKSSGDQAKKKKDMLNNIVNSITELVNQQINSRTCIPLSSELKQCFTKLLSVRKHSKISPSKMNFPILGKQPEQNFAIDEEIDTNRFVRSIANTIDTKVIHDKYNTITNLQNSFNKLTTADQIRYNTMKEFINKHLPLLDELNEISRRNVRLLKSDGSEMHQPVKRDTFNAEEEFNPDLNTIEIKQPFNDQMTERFIKLSKMVEFMRQNALLDATDYEVVGNDFIL